MTPSASPAASTTNLASPMISTENLIRSSSTKAPRPSLWASLKAENDERKRRQSQRVTSEEARQITGYGEEKKGNKVTSAAEAALLTFDYNPNRAWGVKETLSVEKEEKWKKARVLETKKKDG